MEWLVEFVHSTEYQMAFGVTYISPVVMDKALEIEKQQIEKVFVDVTRATLENLGIKSTLQDVIDFKKIAEVYYNEEFKSK